MAKISAVLLLALVALSGLAAAHARGVQTGTGCPFWRPLVQCLVDPCTVTTCLVNTTCESNYCGGCNARCVPIVAPKPRFNLRDKLCSLIGGIWCYWPAPKDTTTNTAASKGN